MHSKEQPGRGVYWAHYLTACKCSASSSSPQSVGLQCTGTKSTRLCLSGHRQWDLLDPLQECPSVLAPS